MAVFTVLTTDAGNSAGKNGIDHVRITRVVPVFASIVDSNSMIVDTSGVTAPASIEQTGVVCEHPAHEDPASARTAHKADERSELLPAEAKQGKVIG